MLRREQRLLARDQAFGHHRCALLPLVAVAVGDMTFADGFLFGGQVYSEWLPVVSHEAHGAFRAPDRDRASSFFAPVMSVWVEKVKTALNVRKDAIAVIE